MSTLEGSMLARICTQIERLGSRLDADTLAEWRSCVADRNVHSPGAKGCLLELVRQAWGDASACVTPDGEMELTLGGRGWTCWVGDSRTPLFEGATEIEALLAALAAAPS